MPEVTQEMKDFANFMEMYVEPTMAFIYYFAASIMGLVNFVIDVATLLVGLAGFG
ncbi:MAG: hypothetical protein OXC27_18370 [Caldilineaceae bacterium]|nr:hypothetical protein [Caldilineaceae bacterium]